MENTEESEQSGYSELPLESNVQLDASLMRIHSKAMKLPFIEVVTNPKKGQRRVVAKEMELPYLEPLNNDLGKGNLREEELAFIRMKLSNIMTWVMFAQRYNLFLPYINKQVVDLLGVVASSRARNMAAAKLSKTTFSYSQEFASQWLFGRGGQEDEKRGWWDKLLGKRKLPKLAGFDQDISAARRMQI